MFYLDLADSLLYFNLKDDLNDPQLLYKYNVKTKNRI